MDDPFMSEFEQQEIYKNVGAISADELATKRKKAKPVDLSIGRNIVWLVDNGFVIDRLAGDSLGWFVRKVDTGDRPEWRVAAQPCENGECHVAVLRRNPDGKFAILRRRDTNFGTGLESAINELCEQNIPNCPKLPWQNKNIYHVVANYKVYETKSIERDVVATSAAEARQIVATDIEVHKFGEEISCIATLVEDDK